MNHRARTTMPATALLGVMVFGSACGSTGAAVGSPSAGPTEAASPDTTYIADVDVGGRTMHIVCLGPTGTGRPTVIFEHGLGGEYGVWSKVITEVSATERACAYDRAGAGLSESAAGPRTSADQVADLQALLAEARIAAPYVMVGHSSGAWNALIEAAEHPSDVTGVVLVDPRPPSASARLLEALPGESETESDVIHQYRVGYRDWEGDPTGNAERLHLADSALEADAAELGSIPLIVLAAIDDEGEGSDLPPELAAMFASIWAELQEELASRSTSGRFEAIEGSTHDMPFDRPDAIVEAIAEVMGS
jgi:pimeloyl-ACP methyl ester carboxylesterase